MPYRINFFKLSFIQVLWYSKFGINWLTFLEWHYWWVFSVEILLTKFKIINILWKFFLYHVVAIIEICLNLSKNLVFEIYFVLRQESVQKKEKVTILLLFPRFILIPSYKRNNGAPLFILAWTCTRFVIWIQKILPLLTLF